MEFGTRVAALSVMAAIVIAPACSIKKLAAKKLGNALAAGNSVYATDDDPELVRDALPFALKTMESLLEVAPEHPGLLEATCAGFTQYAWAFIETDAEAVEAKDWLAAQEMRERALRMYLRAKSYCLRGLELQHEGISERLLVRPEDSAAEIGIEEIGLLYWTGAAWGAAVSVGVDRPDVVADVDVVRALLRRALELDESYGDGAIHQAMISIEALPEAMGGSLVKAREHFERAVELSGGNQAGTYVSFASSVSVTDQNYEEFRSSLEIALEIDPDAAPAFRLANLVSQRRATILLNRAEELFLTLDEEEP